MAALGWPDLPPQALAHLAEARGSLKPVFLKELPARPGDCPNCAGLGAIWLQFVQSGPFKSPPPREVLAYDNGWYVVENRLYPCPACRDHTALLHHLWRRSGLELGEQEWRLSFYDTLPGKEIALAFAHDLLAALPRPTGWLIYSGAHGVGKSGLLKSVVAACIRAGISAHYTLAEGILQRIRDEFGELDSSEVDVFSAYAAIQVLAIDEVDRVSTTSWSRATLLRLLEGRYNRRQLQATLFASNLPPEGLPDDLSYLVSRLKDGWRAEVGGRDLRGWAARDWLYNKNYLEK